MFIKHIRNNFHFHLCSRQCYWPSLNLPQICQFIRMWQHRLGLTFYALRPTTKRTSKLDKSTFHKTAIRFGYRIVNRLSLLYQIPHTIRTLIPAISVVKRGGYPIKASKYVTLSYDFTAYQKIENNTMLFVTNHI